MYDFDLADHCHLDRLGLFVSKMPSNSKEVAHKRKCSNIWDSLTLVTHKSAHAICVQWHFGVIRCTCLNLLSHNICVIHSCVTHDNLPTAVGLLVDVQFGIERFVTIQKFTYQTTQIQLIKVSQTYF